MVITGSITATAEEACSVVDLPVGTFCRWRSQGEEDIAAGRNSRYREFCESISRAFDQRRLAREQRMVKFSRAKDDQAPTSTNFAALAWIMEKSDPARYAPKVVHHVEVELTSALDALEQEFKDEPEILERALNAIARRNGGRPFRTIEGGARIERNAEDDRDVEAVHAAPALPETGSVP
jgi:hypothetical protein